MWPLLDLEFHCAFLSFDAKERIRNYIISGAISSSFWVFLHGFERYNWRPLEPIFILWMWPLLDLQFHCAFFEIWCRRGKRELHYFWSHFFVFLGVLTWVWNVQLRAFRTYFYFVNVATIGLAIPLRIFWALMQERGKGITLFLEPFLRLFGCSYMGLKGTIEGL